LGVVSLSKYDRKRAWPNSVPRQDADEAAGVDAARKKHSHRHVAHQLHAHRLIEHFRDLGLEFTTPHRTSIASVLARFNKLGVDQIPVLDLFHLPIIPSQIATRRKRTQAI